MAGDGRRNRSNSAKEQHEDEEMDLDMDDNDDYAPSGSSDNNSKLIDNLLETARKNAKRTMASVKVQAEGIFEDAEIRVEELQAGADKDVDERVDNLRSVIDQIELLQQQQSQFQVQALEDHLTELSRLTKAFSDYVETGERSAELDPTVYFQKRRTLAEKTSRRGAREAMRVQKQNNRDQKIMSEAKAFAKAHRDLFRTLDTTTVKEKAAKA